MPRFYFDISPGAGLPDIQDDEGEELEGLNAARIVAVRAACEILRDNPERFWRTGEWSCTVRDESGLTLFTLHFYAAGAPALGGSKG